MVETKRHEPIVYRLYDYLKDNHVGKKNAISGKALSEKFDICTRQLRTHIHDLREDMQFDKVILTCPKKGYYIPTEEEGTADVEQLFKHASSIFRIARAVVNKAGRNGQGKIKLGAYYKDFVEAFGE